MLAAPMVLQGLHLLTVNHPSAISGEDPDKIGF